MLCLTYIICIDGCDTQGATYHIINPSNITITQKIRDKLSFFSLGNMVTFLSKFDLNHFYSGKYTFLHFQSKTSKKLMGRSSIKVNVCESSRPRKKARGIFETMGLEGRDCESPKLKKGVGIFDPNRK